MAHPWLLVAITINRCVGRDLLIGFFAQASKALSLKSMRAMLKTSLDQKGLCLFTCGVQELGVYKELRGGYNFLRHIEILHSSFL